MTCCQQCSGWVFEHVTSDERIVYCQRCGWEHREIVRTRPAPVVAPRRSMMASKPQRRPG